MMKLAALLLLVAAACSPLTPATNNTSDVIVVAVPVDVPPEPFVEPEPVAPKPISVVRSTKATVGRAPPELSGAVYVTGTGPKRLDEALGTVVVLTFFATWAGPSRQAFQGWQSLKNDSVAVIAIAIDGRDDALVEFARDHRATFTVLRDANHGVSTAYDVQTIPMTFLIDESGILRKIQDGFASNTAQQLRAEIAAMKQHGAGPTSR